MALHWSLFLLLISRFLSALLVRLPPNQRRSPPTHLFLFEFLRVSGEGRLISDLSVQRRYAVQQRVACRLANVSAPPATRSTSDEPPPPPPTGSPQSAKPPPITIPIVATSNDENADVKVPHPSRDGASKSAGLHERIVERMMESKVLDVPLPPTKSTISKYHLHQQCACDGIGRENNSDFPKCLLENNGGKFD